MPKRPIVRIARDSLPEENRGQDAQGLVTPVGLLGPHSAIVRQPDGTLQRAPVPDALVAYVNQLPVQQLVRHLDAWTVTQLAAKQVLEGMRFAQVNLERLLETNAADGRTFRLQTIIFDWPKFENDLPPPLSATIVQDGEALWDNQSFATELIEETIDVFAKHTALRKIATATIPMNIVVWLAHTEERRAVRAGFERHWLVEPQDDKSGRRIAVPQYFDREVRFDYLGFTQPDNDDLAHRNRWIVEARFSASVDVVTLVGIPERFQEIRAIADVEPLLPNYTESSPPSPAPPPPPRPA